MPPKVISLKHPSGLVLDLMDVGATWLSCRVPMADGQTREVILGCPHATDYTAQTARMGAMTGRVANRIANARYTRDGITTLLSTDAPPHQLHGGPVGFDQRRWTIVNQSSTHARLQLISADGDQGFPGELTVTLDVTLSQGRKITLEILATTTRETPVSISQHAYFNLDRHHHDVRQHRLQINAAHYLPVDSELIPLGALVAVDESAHRAFDFRVPKTIAADWMCNPQQQIARGYDHAYLLAAHDGSVCQPAATLVAADGQLSMLIATTMPALQLYTGQYLAGITGRDGSTYSACNGVALEPSYLPDSPNHPEWPQPSCWLSPMQLYRHRIEYDFVVHEV
jgi:aldose 1-epimerase